MRQGWGTRLVKAREAGCGGGFERNGRNCFQMSEEFVRELRLFSRVPGFSLAAQCWMDHGSVVVGSISALRAGCFQLRKLGLG